MGNAHGAAQPKAQVVDAGGRVLSPCPAERAHALVSSGEALLVSEEPLTIQLERFVAMPEQAPDQGPDRLGRPILVHTCCAPCSTYTVKRLREIGFQVTGFWYNPNVHPYQEHERRQDSMQLYASQIGLPMIWHPRYEMVQFLRRVYGREEFRRRCAACYAMRLNATAREARAGGFEVFTTTLLISPYQDQEMLRQMGEDAGRAAGVEFYFENFRRGWRERSRLAEEYGLYRQQYCGCIYSEWERYRPAEPPEPPVTP